MAVEQLFDLRCRHGVEKHPLAARDDGRKNHERIEAGRRQDDDAVGVRLLERFQQHALVLVAQAPDVDHQGDTPRTDGWLEVEKRLQ